MRYEEVDYGGEKIKIKVFDYHTPEGWHEYVMNTAGSVHDETFVAPPDGYMRDEDVIKFD
ncbi:MAG: hypothetical protein IJP89_01745 [Synergistaceae bacterium]|nr:hypothetical protein [Synergistaceae bacterium]MBR0257589.1 hypothetical protein [Synergistaceae bacterium]